MFKSLMYRLISSVLKPFGYSVYNTHYIEGRLRRPTLDGALSHLKKVGFAPACIIDVGAAYGTPPLYKTYPDIPQVLIEPLQEYKPELETLAQQYPKMIIVMAAAHHMPGTMEINVLPELDSTSFYTEQGANAVKRTIPVMTLDEICTQNNLNGPYLIKADVEGAELDALRGAEQILKETDCVILETTLFRYREGAPLIHDVIHYMTERGYLLFDIVGAAYRPLDDSLVRIDLVFVREDSPIRSNQSRTTSEDQAVRARKFAARGLERLEDVADRASEKSG